MAIVSKTGTLTGGGTVDAIALTFPTNASVSWVWVAVFGLSGTTLVSFNVSANGGTPQTTLATVGQNNAYHLSVLNPSWPVEVHNATSLTVNMVAASALTYLIIAQ